MFSFSFRYCSRSVSRRPFRCACCCLSRAAGLASCKCASSATFPSSFLIFANNALWFVLRAWRSWSIYSRVMSRKGDACMSEIIAESIACDDDTSISAPECAIFTCLAAAAMAIIMLRISDTGSAARSSTSCASSALLSQPEKAHCICWTVHRLRALCISVLMCLAVVHCSCHLLTAKNLAALHLRSMVHTLTAVMRNTLTRNLALSRVCCCHEFSIRIQMPCSICLIILKLISFILEFWLLRWCHKASAFRACRCRVPLAQCCPK
mmetsp:Transcript_36246/g.58435  ORF Transcript_36246/g.58435 Transcript_36246/m.58435 type:complete len:266 (+) Transcript_36246:689-1486(+)